MEKIAIVVLNYLNYKDTIECVDSIKLMKYDIAGIVVVDNASANESYQILKKTYIMDKNISVIKAKKNYGYAKGNNIGIKYAREKYQTEYIYIVNNDVIFEDEEYFEKLLQVYDEETGVIGSTIVLKGRVKQKKCFEYVTFKEVLNCYVHRILVKFGKDVWISGLPVMDSTKKRQVLKGCGLLFTPNYFEVYDGFYPYTFLYAEEEIVFLICERYGLKQKYVEQTYIYHKEDQSSEMSFGNDVTIMNEYAFQSYKYVVWWAFKNLIWKSMGTHFKKKQ